MSHVQRKLLLAAAVLVLAGFSIDLAGGRWGAYIPSPIPGVFLADLLVGLGALGGLFGLKFVRSYPRLVFVAFGLVAAYLAIRGVDSLFLRPGFDRYLVIRDLAPYGYLLLVPFVAIVLTAVSWVWFIWVVRIAASLHLVGFVLTQWGLITLPASNLGQLSGMAISFPGRGDLLGVIFGIAFLAWGKWPGVVRASRVAQFLILAFGFNLSSRAAFLTMIFCVVLELWRERKLGQMRVLVAVTAAGIITSLVVPFVQSNWNSWSTTQPETTQPQAIPVAAVAKQLSGDRYSIGGNRTATNRIALDSVVMPANLPFGFGLGGYQLWEACTKLAWTSDAVGNRSINERFNFQKCPIDHGNDRVPVRDPHNWLLNSMLYHGAIGTGIWLFGFGAVFWVARREKNASLAVISIGAYFVCGTFQVIMSAPFALLPTAVFLAWLLSRYLLSPTTAATKPPLGAT